MVESDEQDLEDTIVENEDPLEDEDDVPSLSNALIAQAVVSATDWTAETILNQINKGNIILNPKFQRRDAWTPTRKSSFIESLIMGFPTPQIVLAESRDKKGAYIVLDGKQRLLSIRQFAAEPNDQSFEVLELKSLGIRGDLNNKSLNDLKDDLTYSEEVTAFENQTIRTVVIKNWPNDDFLFHVFLRLNTGSVKLSPQELRQALLPGPFIDFADVSSFDSRAIKSLLKLSKPDFRMRDVELLIRYIAFQNFLPKYSGSMKGFLDETCTTLNQQWDEKRRVVERQMEELDEAYDVCSLIFDAGHVCRKWTKGGYQPRFNRAIFDFLMFYFSDREVRELVKGKEEKIVARYRELCEGDQEFVSSIERTTKSIESTCTRFAKWAQTLNDITGTELSIPFVKERKIVM